MRPAGGLSETMGWHGVAWGGGETRKKSHRHPSCVGPAVPVGGSRLQTALGSNWHDADVVPHIVASDYQLGAETDAGLPCSIVGAFRVRSCLASHLPATLLLTPPPPDCRSQREARLGLVLVVPLAPKSGCRGTWRDRLSETPGRGLFQKCFGARSVNPSPFLPFFAHRTADMFDSTL